MKLIYNIGIWLMGLGLRAMSLFKRKARLWVQGRRGIFDRLREAIPTGEKIVWVHCASLGEFEQGRPLIEAIKARRPEYKILLTFFSPSGYEIRKDYPGADYIFYMPLDTPRNARRFVAEVQPEIAVFVKYEFWLNFLGALDRAGCRTFIVSSIFRRNSVFFKPYGGIFRRALGSFERIFVQNEASRELLADIGITRVTVAGDTRFDRVAAVRENSRKIDVVERFTKGGKTLVAGSTWAPDEELLAGLAARFPGVKFVVAPHEMDNERIDKFIASAPGGGVRYTDAQKMDALPHVQVMVIDTIGILSSVYAYADFAYIGGGFGAGIHNTLEAAVYGVPVAFGPNYEKFQEARELILSGAARSIADLSGLEAWLSAMTGDSALLADMGRKAGAYVAGHTGATDKIVETLFRQG